MEQPIYFIHGHENRLNSGYNHLVKQLETETFSMTINPIFILSGSSMLNPTPKITEARRLKQKLGEIDYAFKISEENVILNEQGVERLGCFLEAKKTIEELNIKKPKVYIPVESRYESSYTTLFSRITGVGNIETIKAPPSSTLIQKIEEVVVSNAINFDTKEMDQNELIKYINKFKHYNGKDTYDTKGLYSILWRLQELKSYPFK